MIKLPEKGNIKSVICDNNASISNMRIRKKRKNSDIRKRTFQKRFHIRAHELNRNYSIKYYLGIRMTYTHPPKFLKVNMYIEI